MLLFNSINECIVFTYYLTYKSQIEGYLPQVVLAGRRINGNAEVDRRKIDHKYIQEGMVIRDSNILVLDFLLKKIVPI